MEQGGLRQVHGRAVGGSELRFRAEVQGEIAIRTGRVYETNEKEGPLRTEEVSHQEGGLGEVRLRCELPGTEQRTEV